jgi:hypothetical protein
MSRADRRLGAGLGRHAVDSVEDADPAAQPGEPFGVFERSGTYEVTVMGTDTVRGASPGSP